VIHPTDDPFSDETKALEVAASLGAGFTTLDAVGHFWPYQAPEAGAAVLEAFWASL
jgi:predicted alpha/beta hydrolase family esterase